MSKLVKILKPVLYKPWQPPRPWLLAEDLFRPASQPAYSHEVHLDAALTWLCLAQDVRNNHSDHGGVSAGWNFEDGWLPSYPETTGYIIETFLTAARALSRPELRDRAVRMIDWELSIQSDSGAFPGHHGEAGSQPVIFNTGQIIHGLMAGHDILGREDCLAAAVRAAHWMADALDPDGCWRKFEYKDLPHVYNTRATWAMIRVGLASGDDGIISAARRQLNWALSRQAASGWFRDNTFAKGQDPVTHTIAYAIRGLLESGVLLDAPEYTDAAEKAARAIARVQHENGWLAGSYTEDWHASARYCCVTGVAQMALCWLRLAKVTGDPVFRKHAERAIVYVKRTQRINHQSAEVSGAIPGSVPIWGRYARLEFPNWAAKFFADALMMDLWNIDIPTGPSPELAPAYGESRCQA